MLYRSRQLLRLVAAGALLWLTGCGSSHTALLSLDQLYQRGIADAAVADPGEVSHTLDRIVPENPRLRWRLVAGRPEVLLVTWTSYTGYDALVGRPTTLAREVWVTCAPRLREEVTAHTPPVERELRAAQLLGVPPQPGKTRFVELWVAPSDLFRPATDPDITTDSVPPDSFPGLPSLGLGTAYLTWYNNLKASSYGANGYPWTRLGYTYDWGNPGHEEGLSEFVVRPGATVEVAAVTANAAYLN